MRVAILLLALALFAGPAHAEGKNPIALKLFSFIAPRRAALTDPASAALLATLRGVRLVNLKALRLSLQPEFTTGPMATLSLRY